ncbi:MAG: histidine kinase [Nitrospinales bacterium]
MIVIARRQSRRSNPEGWIATPPVAARDDIENKSSLNRFFSNLLKPGRRAINMFKLSKKPMVNRTRYLVIVSLLAMVFLLIDVLLPKGVAGGELYVVLVLIGLLSREKTLIIWAAVVGMVLTLVGLFFSLPVETLWTLVVNRLLAILMIALTAMLCLLQHRSSQKLFEARDKLAAGLREHSNRLKEANEMIHQESAIIQLQKDIAVSSNQNRPFEEAMRYSLRRVCKETGWPVGHMYFTAEKPKKVLLPSRIWYFEDSKRFENFRKITEVTSFPPGVGLPGRVLASGKPAWIKDVTQDLNFPRAQLMQNIEVRGGFAFPVLVGDDVGGVMEFFSSRVEEPNSDLLELMVHIGTQLGRVVERKRSEDEQNALLRKLEQRVKELTSLYEVAGAVRRIEKRADLFNGIASFIVSAWQYPEIARVRVFFDGKEYVPIPFEKTPWKQSSDIIIEGKVFGSLEVYYLEDRTESDESPFLKEERKLLDELAHLLGEAFERKWVHKEIAHSQKQLRQLSRHIELVREEERTRIAREVHDELGQVLTALKLELSLLSKKLSRSSNGFQSATRRMLQLVDQTIQAVKRISSDLRPPILDVFGLAEAIEWQGKEFQARTGIRFEIEARPKKIRLDQSRSTTVFRIFQEILTNVARHANAKKISVNLTDKNDILTLEVRDDGIGITKQQIADLKSLGILGMRERALAWGGTLDLRGAPNQGTVVTMGIRH